MEFAFQKRAFKFSGTYQNMTKKSDNGKAILLRPGAKKSSTHLIKFFRRGSRKCRYLSRWGMQLEN